jgi:hypothetical protein
MQSSTLLKRLALGLLLAALAYFGIMSLRCSRYCHGFWDRFFFALFVGEDHTKFASGYNEAHFATIGKGLRKADVIRLLGEPLKRNVYHAALREEWPSNAVTDYEESWQYSSGPPGANYWFRYVLFDRDGIVVATEAKYFVD